MPGNIRKLQPSDADCGSGGGGRGAAAAAATKLQRKKRMNQATAQWALCTKRGELY